MGALEAFAIGALAGGGGGLVIYLVLAQSAKGRTTTTFAVPGWSSAQVLQVVQAFLQSARMRPRPIADGIAGEEGSEWTSGVRVLEVRTRDRAAGGTDVTIDVYIRGLYPKEINADPRPWFGMVPRRKAFGLAQGLAAALGAQNASWEHRRA